MSRRWFVVWLAAVGCGRIAFDPRDDDAGGDGSTSGGDAGGLRVAYLKSSEAASLDRFGNALAISADGQTIAVGAPTQGAEAGAVYIFRRAGETWQEDAIVRPDVWDIGDQFGWSVGLSGNGSTLVVGARREDSGDPLDPADNGTMSAGAAYVFSVSTAGWSQIGYLKPPTTDVGDAFGERVAISEDGSTVAIGVPEEDSATNVIDGSSTDNNAPEAGAVWIFAGLPWAVQSYIKAPNADPGDAFGYRLSLAGDGNLLLVGAFREDNATTGVGAPLTNDGAPQAGAAYVFVRSGAAWGFMLPIKATNTDMGDNFGYVVELAADGTSSVIAAIGEGGSGNVLPSSGAVYAYTTEPWTQTHLLKATEATAGDELGYCAAIAATSTFIVGAIFEDSDGSSDPTDNSLTDSGAVYSFSDQGSGFVESRFIKATTPGADDWFGFACDISADGMTIVVGAPQEDGGGRFVNAPVDETAPDAGAVYVYY